MRGCPMRRRRAAKDLRRLSPDDQQDHLLGRRLVDPALPGHPAVAQHHHAIGDLEHLIEPMRDVDDADPAVAQAAQSNEQARHLVGGQAGGRLVEHEDLRLRSQRARDRHQRLLGPAEALDAHIRVDVSVEHIKGSCGAPPRRPPVDQAAAPRIAEGEADILGHGHPVDQAEVLVDERNRQATQRAGRVVSAELDAAGIKRVNAGEDLDQRGLARAVLAEQRQDLAGAKLEVHVIERQRAPEALGYASEFQHRCALRAGRSIRRQSGRRGAQVRIASRSQPARPGRAPGRYSRARHLTYGPRSNLVHAFGRRLIGDRISEIRFASRRGESLRAQNPG